jgi:ABC-type taurine transport system substrate-binding protein
MKSLFRSRAVRGSIFAVPIVATSLAAAIVATPAGAKAKNKPISVEVGYIGTQNIFTGPEGFAYSKGLLQKWLKPYKITIKGTAAFANGPLLTAALVGGSLQLGEIGDTPALVGESPATGAGDGTRIINQSQVNLQSVLITSPAYTSLSQLSGKAIYRQPQSYMDRWVQALLQSKGMLTNVTLGPGLLAQFIPEFNSGQIPDLVLPPSDLPLIKTRYKVLANSAQTPAWTGTSVTEVTKDTLTTDPGFPAAWNYVRDEAITYAKAHPTAYYAFQGKAEETPAAEAKKYYPLSGNPIQPFSPAGITHLKGTLAFLVSQKEATTFSIASWQAK